jgi:hypothetical protein
MTPASGEWYLGHGSALDRAEAEAHRQAMESPEPLSVEEALATIEEGLKSSEPMMAKRREGRTALALLRSELDRLRGIEEAAEKARDTLYEPGVMWIEAAKILDTALACDRQEEGDG